MRVSTAQVFTVGIAGLDRQQADLLHTQQQISASQRVLTPADDPVAAAQAVTVTQASNQNDEYASNINTANSALSQSDSVLSQVENLLQSVRTSAVQGGNATLADSDRASIAADVSAATQQLVGLGNSKDGNGNYMFSGFQTGTQPFATDSSGNVVYHGDQGVRQLRVSASRTVAISDAGSTIFEQVRNGNGAVVAAANGSNAGTGVAAAGQVITPAAVNGDKYSVQFAVLAGATTYSVVDSTTGTTLSTGNAYSDGAAITVGGMQFAVSGAPASGDSFTVGPSTQQSIFATLQGLVATLQTPVATAADSTKLTNGINAALQAIDQALGNVLEARTGVGASLQELDSATTGNQDNSLQYSQSLSTLQDLDYNKALSDLSSQQLALTAAQKSFVTISSLSLFNYL